MVGGLSLINAVAGAYAENLPLLVVSGGPNSNDGQERHLVHHTIGEIELYQQAKCFEPVTAACYSIRHIKDACEMVDKAIEHCIRAKKPVYLEIACNLSAAMIAEPTGTCIPPKQVTPKSDPESLQKVVEDIAQCLHASTKPVLVCGSKVRSARAMEAFRTLADVIGCGAAIMPDAKGQFPESHPQFLGVYWGSISDPNVAEIVESSDLMIFCGPVFNDYTTQGWSALISGHKLVHIGVDAVALGDQRRYGNLAMADVLNALIPIAPARPNSMIAFKRFSTGMGSGIAASGKFSRTVPADTSAKPSKGPDGGDQMPQSIHRWASGPLTLADLCDRIQGILTPRTSLIVETGDCWFIGQRMRLPEGARYYSQMQYGSIGWAFASTLGIALAEGSTREVITLTGDGAFQMTAQELSTMIRQEANCTIILINNGSYTIECQIHDNIYNDIKNWSYADLIEVFRCNEKQGACFGRKVETMQALDKALADMHDIRGVKLLECCISRDDCTSSLLQWGARVAAANMRM